MNPLLVSLLGALLLAIGPLGSRAGLWNYAAGFLLIALAVIAGAAGLVLSLTMALRTHAAIATTTTAMTGAVIGLVVIAVPIWMVLSFRGAPAIHDITTDPIDPPAFQLLLALRTGAANPPEYDGAAAALKQHAAYPDIQPVIVADPPAAAYARALTAATHLKWAIAAADAATGRIEATDTTFWFGFKDDIVIRIRAEDDGSRIDVRSKSRVGISDGGANARRIRALIGALRSTAQH
jgi:uncharacterized protein (DUF1499 family)